MKGRWLGFVPAALVVLWLGSRWAAPAGGRELEPLATLPVAANGRVQPLDSLARNSLLRLSGKQSFRGEDGRPVPALGWLLEILRGDDVALERPVFLIRHPEVRRLFGWEDSKEKRFGYNGIVAHAAVLEEQGKRAVRVEAAKRNAFQRETAALYQNVLHFKRLWLTLPRAETGNLVEERGRLAESGPEGDLAARYRLHDEAAAFLPIPDVTGEGAWHSLAGAMREPSGVAPDALAGWMALADAVHAGNISRAAAEASALQSRLSGQSGGNSWKERMETLFNRLEPFLIAAYLDVFLLLVVAAHWLWPRPPLLTLARGLFVTALVLHTAGLLIRMAIQGRPPVTNLYSSAIFVGWVIVILGGVIERFQKNGLGYFAAGLMGFGSLVIAHQLSISGDTLESMRAVLDSNFWLATHVVTVTIGYSATFLAGFLAAAYLVRGAFAREFPERDARVLGASVYGVVCFATLFSFVGTVLGGIWADQSWGRFWGWDPKENGALMIVLWNAAFLHARWGKVLAPARLMQMAVFGNVITAFSWFGVNMLGVGLHSYGFMDKAFFWLAVFVGAQMLVILLGFKPVRAVCPSPAETRRVAQHGNISGRLAALPGQSTLL